MQAVILAGGFGTRLAEETHLRPKPMVEIGGLPILWHILKIYSAHGINDFIICCGYKGYVIKEYFANYFLHTSDVTFDMQKNSMEVHYRKTENWKVTLIDTGENTMTGGRLKRVKEFLHPEEPFCFTYGDGLSDVNITNLIEYHHSHGRLATVTAVIPPSRYGALELENADVIGFEEKPSGEASYINGGFFVLSPKVIDLIADDSTSWEGEPLKKLAMTSQLVAFHHKGFWQPMDTIREKNILEQLWLKDKAPWKTW